MFNTRNVLVYNSQCEFCTDVAYWLQGKIGHRKLTIIPNDQKWATKLICKEVGYCDFQKDVHLVRKDKSTWVKYHSGQACIEALSMIRGFGFLSKMYKVWPINAIIEIFYKLVKRHKASIYRIFKNE